MKRELKDYKYTYWHRIIKVNPDVELNEGEKIGNLVGFHEKKMHRPIYIKYDSKDFKEYWKYELEYCFRTLSSANPKEICERLEILDKRGD